MIKRAAAAIIVILFIVMAFGGIFAGCSAVNVFSTGKAASSASPVPETETGADRLGYEKPDRVDGVQLMEMIERRKSFALYAAYPRICGKNVISSEISSFVQNRAELFKNEVRDALQGGNGPASRPELAITYQPYKYKDAVLSFKFTTDAHTGASYTDGFISTYVYNLQTEKRMTLQDVFNPQKDYLRAISSLVRAKLQKNPVLQDQTLFDEGIAPNVVNYSNFVIEQGRVIFFFNRGQIAPAAAGAFEVGLSFESLAGMLLPDILQPPKIQAATYPLQEDLPAYLRSGKGDMKAFNLDGIDPLNDKVVALTFDDGPNPSTTGEILKALKKYGGCATFFVVGELAEEYPSTIQKIHAGGNEIGNHSYSHPDFYHLTTDEILDEVDKTNRILNGILGEKPILVRAPYGNVNEDIARAIGRACIQWTVDSEDWKNLDEDKDYEMVMDEVGDGSIVLMHDIYQPTADAAVRIIRDLTRKGYKLVTVSQLIQIAQARGKETALVSGSQAFRK